MKVSDVLNIVALVVVPILAVLVGQCLQDRAEKRKDKMMVFKTLMTARTFGWTRESVDAMNIIDVVFVNDRGVREAWKSLYDRLKVSSVDTQQQDKINQAKFKLLEEMAKALGYKDKITWETIQNPYLPTGLYEQVQSQVEYNQAMMVALSLFNSMFAKPSEDMPAQGSKSQVD